jgi:cell division protein FtsI/penicillin-binding protein 2
MSLRKKSPRRQNVLSSVKPLQYRRLIMMAFLLALAFAGMGYRLVDLQLVRHEELQEEARKKTQWTVVRAPRRGEIRDIRGNLLAGSEPVKTIRADPVFLEPHQLQVARALAPLLEMSEAEVFERLKVRTTMREGRIVTNRYALVKPNVPLETWERVRETMRHLDLGVDESKLRQKEKQFYSALRQRAIFSVDEQKRVYPNGNLTAHILGFVGRAERETVRGPVFDLAGVEGIESRLNSVLSGVHGWRRTEVARRRELVPFRTQDVEPHPGRNVILTIDAGMQHILENELQEAMREFSPNAASGIVVRPRTGEILALANLPTFDPNRPGAFPADHRRNRAVTDSFEPGSTFKIVVVSGALNDNLVTLDTRIDCEKSGRFVYYGVPLRDFRGYGVLSVEQIVTKSSNIGTAKLALQMGENRLYEHIRAFGFGTPTGIPLEGEVRGIVHPVKSWDRLSITRLPMGQGISTTAIQMVMAMCAVANQGRLMMPMLLHRIEDEKGNIMLQYQPKEARRVISEKAALEMTQALITVVSNEGTARRAQLSHYTVAGKTGTAQKSGGRAGYLPGKYVSSFIGFFPASQPELCIGIFLDEPFPLYYGGATAAPVFSQIAERAARYFAIRPDLMPETIVLNTQPASGGPN